MEYTPQVIIMKDLAKKYSEILTKGEVMELFKLLEEVGSLSEACRRAGIDRKTVYNWEKVKEIRKNTKEKVLEAALSLKPKEVTEFLADKTLEKTINIIARLLVHVYEQAVKAKNKEEFLQYYTEFNRIKEKYSKPLTEPIKYQINELSHILDNKAKNWSIVSFTNIITIEEEPVKRTPSPQPGKE